MQITSGPTEIALNSPCAPQRKRLFVHLAGPGICEPSLFWVKGDPIGPPSSHAMMLRLKLSGKDIPAYEQD